MLREGLVFFGTSDLAGHFRGKGFPAAELPARLTAGIGLARSNIMLSAFGPIYETPFGTEGDLVLIADPDSKVEVPFAGSTTEHFYLGDIRTTAGEPWSCCPRDFLRRAIAALHDETGLALRASFEQELVCLGDERPGTSYGYDSFRQQALFGEALMAALRHAGATPDSFLPEYGPGQYEVTVAPKSALRAADEAVILREMARAVAFRLGRRITFAPILHPDGVGNGTHVHFSLWQGDRPVTYDPSRPNGLSPVAEHFVAGLQHHLPALAAITAPSVASYFRLRPNRWAPTWNTVGYRDRGAAVRICPVLESDTETMARQYNAEFRVADATASPHLVLGALVQAGLDGIRRRLAIKTPPPEFWSESDEARRAAGFQLLPQSLSAALDHLAASEAARGWFGAEFHAVYLQFKRAEARAVAELSDEAVCARYQEAY